MFYDDTMDKISKLEKKDVEVEKKYGDEFNQVVGCNVDVMSEIDRLYGDALEEYTKKLAALDDKFGEIRKRRNEFIDGLLQKSRKAIIDIEDCKKYLEELKELRAKYSSFLDSSFKTQDDEIDSRIEAAKKIDDDVSRLMEIWFLDQKSFRAENQTLEFNSRALQLPPSIQDELRKIIEKDRKSIASHDTSIWLASFDELDRMSSNLNSIECPRI